MKGAISDRNPAASLLPQPEVVGWDESRMTIAIARAFVD